jgi:UDP-3-O-[3-hydroxymyristoyl] glucosamine N-acyltransferase
MAKLGQLAEHIQATLIGDPLFEVEGINDIESAGPEDLTFLENVKYQKFLSKTAAGVVILQPSLLPEQPGTKNYLLHPSPSKAFQDLIPLFATKSLSAFSGIHPSAIISPCAQISDNVSIGPHCVIDARVVIGSGTSIAAGCVIGPDVTIGRDCHLHAKVVLEQRTILKNRVIIQPGAIIGSCGFGYHTDHKGQHHPYEHFGNVILEDDVEIGANTTIDRARFKSTTVGKGTKIDNLVQIAHQVHLGERNLIVSQVGIAGSTKTGNQVVIGGQAGVAGHVTIGDNIIITACAAVSKSLTKPDVYYGAPATPDKEFKKQFLALRRVEKFIDRFKDLEKRFGHLIPDAHE